MAHVPRFLAGLERQRNRSTGLAQRRDAINKYLWNATEEMMFYDYDFVMQKQSTLQLPHGLLSALGGACTESAAAGNCGSAPFLSF